MPFIYRAELGLVESVETAKLLLFPQTEAIFAHFAAAGTMLTRLELRFVRPHFSV
jgi:hypothetical protein